MPSTIVHRMNRSDHGDLSVVGHVWAAGSSRAVGSPAEGARAVVARYIQEHITGVGLPAPVVVGHSMGAQVVGQLLADHPDAASAGVLVGPTAEPGTRTIPRQAARLAVDAVGEPPRTIGVLIVDALVRCSVPYYLGQLRHVVDHRLEDVLPRSTVPVAVVRGRRDPVAPAHWIETLVAAAPFGQQRTVRGRHHAMDADPGGVAEIVREAWRAGRGIE